MRPHAIASLTLHLLAQECRGAIADAKERASARPSASCSPPSARRAPSSASYVLHCAAHAGHLAGLPDSVVEAALRVAEVLEGDREAGSEVLAVEVGFALDPATGAVRGSDPDEERFPDLVYGHADIVLRQADGALILRDWKTGTRAGRTRVEPTRKTRVRRPRPQLHVPLLQDDEVTPMKPEGPVARRADYTFDAAPRHRDAAALIRAEHYARGCSRTAVVVTVMRKGDEIVGAALWMPPTAKAAKALAKRLLGDQGRHREVLTLSRLAVRAGEPKNAASLLLGQTTRDAFADPRWTLFVTYADERLGHRGTIYKATGWAEDGVTEPSYNWLDELGGLVSKLSTKNRLASEMRAMGLTRVRSRKLRFVKRRGTESMQLRTLRRPLMRVRPAVQAARASTGPRSSA